MSFGFVYGLVGLVVAGLHHYLSHLGSLDGVLSAVFAIVVWPLLLFGIHVGVHQTV